MYNNGYRRNYGNNQQVPRVSEVRELRGDVDAINDRLVRANQTVSKVLKLSEATLQVCEELLSLVRANNKRECAYARDTSSDRQDKFLQTSSSRNENIRVHGSEDKSRRILDKVLSKGSKDDGGSTDSDVTID